MYNVKKDVPYFLELKTPNYVWDLPINNHGLYNMIGNVSEMILEKGVAKGGSYLDSLENCKISGETLYEGPSMNIGFRTMCEIIK